MRNNGKHSEEVFERHWAVFGKTAYLERLVDTKIVKGILRAKGIKDVAFIPANPADYTLTVNGVMGYAEVKSTQNLTSFPFDFTKAQWGGMVKQVAAKGRYDIFIHQVIKDEWYMIPAELVLSVHTSGKSSIDWKTLEDQRWIPQTQMKRKNSTKLENILI